MFTSCLNSGFQVSYPNGLMISIQFSPHRNYCSNRDLYGDPTSTMKTPTFSNNTAEVACYYKDKPVDLSIVNHNSDETELIDDNGIAVRGLTLGYVSASVATEISFRISKVPESVINNYLR